jgi:hypothetical protein
MDNDGIYRTGQAAARAGVSEPVLRMWERRYGLAPSARSARPATDSEPYDLDSSR